MVCMRGKGQSCSRAVFQQARETAGSCFRICLPQQRVCREAEVFRGVCVGGVRTLSAVCRMTHPVPLPACREKRLREWKQEKVRVSQSAQLPGRC